MKILKKDIAIETLECAIILFFQDKYVYPTHTLIMSLSIMLEDLCTKKWAETMWNSIDKEHHKELRAIQRQIVNFSKHSDRNTDDSIEVKAKDLRKINEVVLAYTAFLLFPQIYSGHTSIKYAVLLVYVLEKHPWLFRFSESQREQMSFYIDKLTLINEKEDLYNFLCDYEKT